MEQRDMDGEGEGGGDGRKSSMDEQIEKLYEIFDTPMDQRRAKYAAVKHVLETRRPSSVISTASTASSQSSNRNTQGSFASSRTSYSSNYSTGVISNYALSPVVEEAHSSAAATTNSTPLHRKFTNHLTPSRRATSTSSSSTPQSSSTDAPKKLTSRTRRCPWCTTHFTRPNDFKKHLTQYCWSTTTFPCSSPSCTHISSQQSHAKEHLLTSPHHACRQYGYSKLELHCRREHFGCGYCQGYFGNLEAFVEHFGGQCRPDKVVGQRYQQSRQMRALLQQPGLVGMVEELSLQYRGHPKAYLGLWWTWKPPRMEEKIRMLEFGPKKWVDERNPGLAWERMQDFLRELVEPSQYSVVAQEVALPREEKELPPLPSYPEENALSETEDVEGEVEEGGDEAMMDSEEMVGTEVAQFECQPYDTTQLLPQAGIDEVCWPHSVPPPDPFVGAMYNDVVGWQYWNGMPVDEAMVTDEQWCPPPEQDVFFPHPAPPPQPPPQNDGYVDVSPAARQAASWLSR